jgi:hypothetical protein
MNLLAGGGIRNAIQERDNTQPSDVFIRRLSQNYQNCLSAD